MKRARADGGGGGAGGGGGRYSAAQKRAIRAAIKERQEFPYRDFGRAHIRRGSESSLATFGPTARTANAEQKAMRQMYGFSGRGLYTGRGAYGVNRLKKARRWTGFAEDVLNRGMGMASLLSGQGLYTGRGAYSTNALISDGDIAPEVPRLSSMGDETGEIFVSKREYVCDIYGPTDSFNVQSFYLNPGLESTFPWLSQIAQNYDGYEPVQMIWTFRSTMTDYATTNGQCGTIIMATNYNPTAAPFTDKQSMMEYAGAMSAKTTDDLLHGIECDPEKSSGSKGKFVRANPVVTGQDLKTYDHGVFQVGVANIPSTFINQSIGELWVSYTFKLRNPKFFTGKGLGISQDLYVSGGGESNALLMGAQSSLLSAQMNNIGTKLTLTNNTITITFPATYTGMIEIQLFVESITIPASTVPMSVAVSTNVSSVSDIYASSDNFSGLDSPSWVAGNLIYSGSGTLAGQAWITIHVFVEASTSGTNNTVTLTSSGSLTGTPTQSQLTIREYNSGFSYRANNVGGGVPGTQSLAPILINPSGLIVVP